MLEKKQGDISVSKLRAILLIEADFNMKNKIIFNMRLILRLKKEGLIPKEIMGGRREKLAIHVVLNKKLLVDIMN